MKIKVTDVRTVARGVELWFDECLYKVRGNNPRLSAVGTRVMRILSITEKSGTQIYEPGNTGGRCFLVEGARSVKGFESVSAAQRRVDTYANVRLTATFKETKVFTVASGTSASRELKTVNEVKQAWADGHQVRVNMLFLLNLPTFPADWEALEPVLMRVGMHLASDDRDNTYGFSANAVLSPDWKGKDPWALMKSVQPKLLAALAPLG